MAESSRDAGDLPALKDLTTPIMGAVAYPPHLLYVPPELWGIAIIAGSTIGMLAGVIGNTGVRADLAFLVAAPMLVYFGIRFRRDKHVAKRWLAKYLRGLPRPPIFRTLNLRGGMKGQWNLFV